MGSVWRLRCSLLFHDHSLPCDWDFLAPHSSRGLTDSPPFFTRTISSFYCSLYLFVFGFHRWNHTHIWRTFENLDFIAGTTSSRTTTHCACQQTHCGTTSSPNKRHIKFEFTLFSKLKNLLIDPSFSGKFTVTARRSLPVVLFSTCPSTHPLL